MISTWRENTFITFGTFNFLAALMIPRKRPLPLTGLEFTFAALEAKQFPGAPADL